MGRDINAVPGPSEAGASQGPDGRPSGPPEDSLGTALWLLGRGLWPVPISPPDDRRSPSPGKAPIGRGWGKAKPSPARLGVVFRSRPGAGVGILLGPEGGVIDLEVDDPEGAVGELRRLFPAGMPATMGWRSDRGEHRLFAWSECLVGLGLPGVVALAGGAGAPARRPREADRLCLSADPVRGRPGAHVERLVGHRPAADGTRGRGPPAGSVAAPEAAVRPGLRPLLRRSNVAIRRGGPRSRGRGREGLRARRT